MIDEIVTFEEGATEIVTFDEGASEIVTFNEGGTTGTNDYERLINKPSINNVELIKNKTSSDLGLQDEMRPLTNLEIRNLIGGN